MAPAALPMGQSNNAPNGRQLWNCFVDGNGMPHWRCFNSSQTKIRATALRRSIWSAAGDSRANRRRQIGMGPNTMTLSSASRRRRRFLTPRQGTRCILSLMIAVMMTLQTTAASPSLAADRLIKLSHPNSNDPFDNATGSMATVFKSLVEAESGGRIGVDIYPDGQLGSDDAAVTLV